MNGAAARLRRIRGVIVAEIGVEDGTGNYEASSGVPCRLNAAAPAITIYAPPNDGSHPGVLERWEWSDVYVYNFHERYRG